MSTVVIIALAISMVIFLILGVIHERRTRTLGDLFPLVSGKEAKVNNSKEFSSSTVATTVSLATLIVAYFELASYFGVWLFWTVLTTTVGIYLVRLFASKIWEKISNYDHRPTLHAFLGIEYGSKSVSFIAAVCTSIGFLGVLATELTVGSRFLAGLIDKIPPEISVILLSVIAFLYTAMGGFRVVIVSDRWQMLSIWGLIIVLFGFYFYYLGFKGNWDISFEKIPKNVLSFNWREGLGAFLVGILLINTPYYIADMSIWQRIGGAQKSETVYKGLWNSVLKSGITWTLLVVLSIFVFLIIVPVNGENTLVTLLNFIGIKNGIGGKIVLFLIIIGLFGAMLSTASTQLIAVSHTLYEDIISRFRNITLQQRLASNKELRISRLLLVFSAIIAVLIVDVLSRLGFSIADLVFAIYGAQLSLTPLVVLALFDRKGELWRLSKWAVAAVGIGFLSGWSAAIVGKIVGINNLVFLSPGFSFGISIIILGFGYLKFYKKN